MRVPAIIRAPGLSPGRSRLLMNFADLHATIRGLLGLTVPPCEHEKCLAGGFNLAPALKLAPSPPATAVDSVVKREGAAVETEKEVETVPKGAPGNLRDILPIFKGRLLMAIRLGIDYFDGPLNIMFVVFTVNCTLTRFAVLALSRWII